MPKSIDRYKYLIKYTYLWRKIRHGEIPCHHYLFRFFFGFVSGAMRFGPTEGSIEKPSISLVNSSPVRQRASAAFLGHWKRPSESRIYNRTYLSPVQSNPLTRSSLVPQNKNKVSFSNVSMPYRRLTKVDNPSIPLRRSDLPTASMIFEKVSPSLVSMPYYPQDRRELSFVYRTT